MAISHLRGFSWSYARHNYNRRCDRHPSPVRIIDENSVVLDWCEWVMLAGGHYWDYCAGTQFLSHYNSTSFFTQRENHSVKSLQLIWRSGTGPKISSKGTRSPNELQWFD